MTVTLESLGFYLQKRPMRRPSQGSSTTSNWIAAPRGASVATPKMAIPGVGRQATIKDPDGNLFGVHQPDKDAK